MYNVLNPLYPQPAMSGNSYITSQITTVTTGATTVVGYVPSSTVGEVQLVAFDIAGDPVRVFWEGTAPTSATGHLLSTGTLYTWAANRYNNAKFILSGSGTASVVTASPLNGG